MKAKEKQEKKQPRKGRIVFRIFMIALISLFLGGMIYSINARRVLHNAMPMPFGVGLSVVLTGSMEPTLSENDLVIVKEADSYEINDIVVYQRGTELIIHRLISVDGDLYTMQGDANNVPDEPVGLSVIKGKEVASVPYIGFVIRLLQTTVGKIVVIALAAFLLHRSRTKERTEDDEELDQIKDEIRKLKALEEERLDKAQTEAPPIEGPNKE